MASRTNKYYKPTKTGKYTKSVSKSGTVPDVTEYPEEERKTEEKRAIMALTPARREVFLTHLAKHGIFNSAARAASPHSKTGCISTFVTLRKEDPEFAAQCEEAIETAKGKLEEELHRRAVEGWLDPVYQKGEKVGEVRKFSDRLLELAVKAKLPEYREKAEVKHAHAGVIAVANLAELTGKLSAESREDLRRIILREVEPETPNASLPAPE